MLARSSRDTRAHRVGAEVAPDDVAAEGQRQAVGPVSPPDAQVRDAAQAVVPVRQLPFVDEQPRLDRAVHHGRLYRIEGHHPAGDAGAEELQREVRAVVSSPGIATVAPSRDGGPSGRATTIGP